MATACGFCLSTVGVCAIHCLKGSVALNGVSLTVNEVDGMRFDVNVIPFTLAHTSWGDRVPGDPVNLEVDLLARYVARLAQTEGKNS